ncbi:MAG: hypothetical protein ACI9P7_000563 [Candidatus Azotimanducaceae bacterium]|jgi:hypothetical protein
MGVSNARESFAAVAYISITDDLPPKPIATRSVAGPNL